MSKRPTGLKYKKHKENPTSFKKGVIPWNKGKVGVMPRVWNKGMDKKEFKSHYKEGFKGAVIQNKSGEHHPNWKGGESIVTCENCKKEILRKRCLIKENSNFFCSRECGNIYHGKTMVGENHPNWLGGKSFEPYNEFFNTKFKKVIRKRDNQICMLCRTHREKLKRTLHIHHINYDKLLSIKENCLSLCDSCHMKTNFNRKHWINFFQSLLSEKYGYQYDNKEIILNVGVN